MTLRNLENNLRAWFIGVAIATASLGGTFAFAGYMQRSFAPTTIPQNKNSHAPELDRPLVAAGHKLFLMNCAHCHAEDATGDEGPDLHGLRKADERLRLLIKNGIKGEMPRFGEKLADHDVDALVAFLDSMR